MSSLEELFRQIDDLCQIFEPRWQQQLLGQGIRQLSNCRKSE